MADYTNSIAHLIADLSSGTIVERQRTDLIPFDGFITAPAVAGAPTFTQPAVRSIPSTRWFLLRRIVCGGGWVQAGTDNAATVAFNIRDDLRGRNLFDYDQPFSTYLSPIGLANVFELDPGILIKASSTLTVTMTSLRNWIPVLVLAAAVNCPVTIELIGQSVNRDLLPEMMQKVAAGQILE